MTAVRYREAGEAMMLDTPNARVQSVVSEFTPFDADSAVPSNGQIVPLVLPERMCRVATDAELLHEFLRALHPSDFRELRAFRADKSTPETHVKNFAVTDLAAVDRFAQTYRVRLDVYVGVAPRRDSHGRSKEHCDLLYALYADLDFKRFASEHEARARADSFPLKPSVRIHSGAGLQLYWLLVDPFILRNGGEATAKSVLEALATALGADIGCIDVARVLRLPGTLNHKYGEPLPVVFESFDVSRRYSLRDFTNVLTISRDKPDETKSTRPVKHGLDVDTRIRLARAWAARQAPAVQGEGGDTHTYKVCCGVEHGHDLTDDSAVEALRDWNTRCDPPWKEADLRQKIRNAARYAKGRRGGLLAFKRDTNKKDKPIIANSQQNIALAVAKLGATLRYDRFAQKARAYWRECNGGALDDAVRDDLWLEIDARFHFRPSPDFFDTVIRKLARSNAFHPVKDYLAALQWDKTPRLDTWLVTYGKAADTEYVRAVSRLPLIAAVRRVRKPGCKFDELLVLESGQGTQKSTAVSTLSPEEAWFSDDFPLGAEAKVVVENTASKWIIEASELYGSARDVDRLKAMLSRRVDGPVRMAYARLPVEVPRQWIAIGTTNNRSGYLKDATGARRFWPVHVGQFDLEALRRDRDQLWAEAAYREQQGESIRLDPKLYAAAAAEQEQRRLADPWEELLEPFLEGDTVSAVDIWQALGSQASQRDNRAAERVTRILQRNGYVIKKRIRMNEDVQTQDDTGRFTTKRVLVKRWVWFRNAEDAAAASTAEDTAASESQNTPNQQTLPRDEEVPF